MTPTRASRGIAGGSGPVVRTQTAARPARGAAVSSMIALQRSAGNTSTMALLRRARGRLVVRKLTPLGWVRRLTVTMADCLVDSYLTNRGYESLRLTFSRVQVEQ